MKLTGLLKSKVEAASTKEEKKSIIAEAGMELTDEALDNVAGGVFPPEKEKIPPKPKATCPYCGKQYSYQSYLITHLSHCPNK